MLERLELATHSEPESRLSPRGSHLPGRLITGEGTSLNLSSCPARETQSAALASRDMPVCVCVCVCLCKGLLSMLSHYWGAQRCRDRPGGTPFGVKGPHVCRCGFIGASLCQSPLPAWCVAVSGTGLLLSSCSGFLVGPGAQGSQGDPGSLAHPSAPWAPAGLGTLSSQRSLVLPEAPLALEPPGGPLALGAPHPPWGPAVLLHPQFRSCPLTL